MVAKEAKRDLATVSMALRSDPRLRPETIQHVKEVAARMGYVQDLAVSAVMSRLRTSQRTSSAEVLAYLHARPLTSEHEGTVDGSDPFYAGAKREAQRQGYKIDSFDLSDPSMSPQRLSQVLSARGIRGVLIAPFPAGQSSFEMEWDRFSAVALGASLHSPIINRVTNGQYSSLRIAMEHLVERGYQRIGFAIHSVHNARLQGAFLGAYLACQNNLPLEQRLAPLIMEKPSAQQITRWIEQEKPDVVISSLVYEMIEKGEISPVKIPDALSFVGTDVSPRGTLSGIFQNHEHDGAEGVRMLVGQLLRNEFGIPEQPIAYTTFGVWHEGETTPLGRPGNRAKATASKEKRLGQSMR